MGRSTKAKATGRGIDIKQGDKVAPTQLLVHASLGTIAYHWPIFRNVHINLAEQAHARLAAHHAEVAALPAGDPQHRMRLCFDENVILGVFDSGIGMVTHAVRAVRHFTLNLETQTAESATAGALSPLQERGVIDRFRVVLDAADVAYATGDEGFSALGELVRIRDAIEHPTQATVYQNDAGWDRVPLAWMFSDRGTDVYPVFRDWFLGLITGWEAKQDRTGTQTLTIERGVKANY